MMRNRNLRLGAGPFLAVAIAAVMAFSVGTAFASESTSSSAFAQSDSKKKSGSKKNRTSLPPEAKIVKKYLKDHLNPDSLKFLKGGRVQMTFLLSKKNEAHEEIFIPRMGTGVKAPFRWSLEGEDIWVGSDDGIRISDKGFAFVNCWFVDDLEAEASFLQHANQNPRMHLAVTFGNERGIALASNYGTQCAILKGSRIGKRGKTKAQGIAFDSLTKIKLVVRNGEFEARRGNSSKAKAKMKYKPKQFKSGRVGFSWGGSTAATITRLQITGKIDMPRMAKFLEKKFGD